MASRRVIDAVVEQLATDPGYGSGRKVHPQGLRPEEAGAVMADLYVAHADAARRLPMAALDLGRVIACKRGCNACCHELVLVNEAEAFLLAEALLEPGAEAALARFEARTPGWQEVVGEVAARAAAAHADGDRVRYLAARHEHQQAQLLCPLNQDGDCALYGARPLACREGWVVDTAERCGPQPDDAPPPQRVSYPGYESFLAMARRVQIGLQGTLGRPPLALSPLPTAVAAALAQLRAGQGP